MNRVLKLDNISVNFDNLQDKCNLHLLKYKIKIISFVWQQD